MQRRVPDPRAPLTVHRLASLAGAIGCVSASLLGAYLPAAALANVTEPVVVAGPDPTIAELGGVAFASDGSGGAIYRKVDDSGSHIYVARYGNGRWLGEQRVDTSLPYSSYEPRLAAAPGGQLLAVWAQDYAHRGERTLFQLQSATLRPGSARFEPPFTVERGVGSDAGVVGNVNDLDPTLVMNDAGIAYLAYRVVTKTSLGLTDYPKRPGDVAASMRVARYVGGTWSRLGSVNRNPRYTLPLPTPTNAPKVSIDRQGNGVVAFIEPDAEGVQRVWARRLFGSRVGYVIKAGPRQIGGTRLDGDSDGFALAGGGLGAAVVVTRQLPGPNSPLAGPRLFSSRLPNAEQDAAREFLPPIQVDDDTGEYLPPSISVDSEERAALVFSSSGRVRRSAVARDGTLSTPNLVDPAPAVGAPQVTTGPRASVMAWPTLRDGLPAVSVFQTLPGDRTARASLVGTRPGPINDMAIAGSGLGDGLIAFRQGTGADSQIVASAAQVEPQPFFVEPPSDWVAPSDATVTWERPPSGVGGVRYDVVINGQLRAQSLTTNSYQVPPSLLEDGEHDVVIRARDLSGQTTNSNVGDLRVDGTPPIVRARLRSGRRVTVSISDPLNGVPGIKASGADPTTAKISFGDGTSENETASSTHRYKRKGRYTITVSASDEAGNRATTTLKVTIR